MPWWRRNSVITFDLGASGLRAAQATRKGRRVCLRDTLEIDLSTPTTAPLDQRLGEVAARLARAAHSGRFVGRRLGLTLTPPTISFHPLKLPEAVLTQPAAKIHEALAWELAREFRVEPRELEVRFWPLPPGHREQLNVMAVYMPAGLAADLVEACAATGLSLSRIDAAPCALARCAAQIRPPAADEIWAVVDFGRNSVCVATLLGRTPVYVRSLPAASAGWASHLAQSLGVSSAEAESILREHGLGSPGRGARSDGQVGLLPRQDLPQVISAALAERLAELQLNIRLCLNYVENNYPSAKSARVFLTGRGAALRGLAGLLTEFLSLETFDLAANHEAFRNRPGLASAVGVAYLDLEAA